MPKHVTASIKETAFSCPHCGALTTQYWYELLANARSDDSLTPQVWTAAAMAKVDWDDMPDKEGREDLKRTVERLASGVPFLERLSDTAYSRYHLNNVHVSKCFNCKDFAVWIYDRLVFPQAGEAPEPNPDLPSEIRSDYAEASAILNRSPRGAAALLRLAIQKLCSHLGGKGKSINDDIKDLVAKGLDLKVQQALDIVRVVGNNAVHPGQLDLSDDRATAETLFRLVNVIADKMISDPKHIAEMYATLPEDAREAISKRDK